jgi:hypothetical protein
MAKTRKSNKRNRKTRRGGDCKLQTNTMFGGNKLVGTELVGGSKRLNGSNYVGGNNRLSGSELVGGSTKLNGSIYGGYKKRRRRVKRGGSSVSVGDLFGANTSIVKMVNNAFGTKV